MKVIQITDDDARALIDDLALAKYQKQEFVSKEEAQMASDMHRYFHYNVVCWLQKHGAKIVK